MSRDRLVTTDPEKELFFHKRLYLARHNETIRVADLIDVAMYSAETEETQKALLDLAIKVMKP